MQLAQETRAGERGYAMAGLLVALAIMSLMLSVAMPTWRTLVQREKEEELIWRGQQYDRAIQLYRKKNATPGAPSVEKLVEGKFLRKQYKDPITNDDFEFVGVNTPSAPGARTPSRGYGELIGGVRSKSKAKSLRVVNGRTKYNEWQFTYVPWKPGGQPTMPAGSQFPGASPQQPGQQGSSPFGPASRPGSSPSGSGSGSGTSPFGPR